MAIYKRLSGCRPLAMLIVLGGAALVAMAAAAQTSVPVTQSASVPTTGPATSVSTDRITVRLVTADGKLASDLEDLQPVVKTTFDEKGTKTESVGERATLWVRNANVDGKFAFELYHEGKYINRRAELFVDRQALGAGEHVIQPGNHKFRVSPEGVCSSDDPEITIDGRTVSLRVYPVDVLAVDAAKLGPPEYRLVGGDIGLLCSGADTVLNPDRLPDPQTLPNMLSHARKFYPLRVYLPSNAVGRGYILFPSFQAFHLTPQGRVDVQAAGSARVPGIEAEGSRIVIPCRTFAGRLSSKTGLKGGVGSIPLTDQMLFSPTIENLRFRAGLGKPEEGFFIPIDNDFSRSPNKFFLADNTTKDPQAVRLLALEWGHPVFTRGTKAQVALRVLETPGKLTVAKPVARMWYSRYNPSSPDQRQWLPMAAVQWAQGQLSFTVPDVPYDFYFVRATVLDEQSRDSVSPLSGEFFACIMEKGQTGTASFFANKGRNAFVAGEEIPLHAVVRSEQPRSPAPVQILLKHPDGHSETLAMQDTGQAWLAKPLLIAADITRNLSPGSYELSFSGLPTGVVTWPFRFDLVSDQKASLFKIIKPAKYTKSMNSLIGSHTGAKGALAIDLDRTTATLAEMGYNRIDLMTYMTNVHIRPHAQRERLAEIDPRLMAPAAVYVPSPRDQILNGCVRNGIEFSDVFLSYNDFTLPRYIQGYIEASKRWLQRELLSMRHSPAMAGMMLYDEMYDDAASGLRDVNQNLWPKVRDQLAEKATGLSPSKVESAMTRYVTRPKNQRDPQALQDYLKLAKYRVHGWGDYNAQVAAAGRVVAPNAKLGTYHRTWMTPGRATGLINGWGPDVFENLDVISHVHYCDNSSGWVHSSIMASELRFGPRRPLWINIPLTHEGYSGHMNGEYQRHMAFAMLAQGADGISQWGLPASFDDDANPATIAGKETTAHLNHRVLAPFGEIISRTDWGYRKVGIVSTLNQHLLNSFKQLDVSHMTEELWIACWRRGYPATFLHEDAMDQPLKGYQIIFVPGIRFDGELEPKQLEHLKEAIAAGTKVVVEAGSELDLPGVIRCNEMNLLNYYVRHYFPTWLDDELEKVFQKTQATTDLLAKKMPEWNVEPAARGPFKVGPNWRSSGAIQYLVMANFDDPDYRYQVKQVLAKPIRMNVAVPAWRGKAAYDLLNQNPVPLSEQGAEAAFDLDMSRMQGGMIAFLPEPVGQLSLEVSQTSDHRSLRIRGQLVGASGKPIKGVFPTRIALMDEGAGTKEPAVYYRTLGEELEFSLNLPAGVQARNLRLEVREQISGRTVTSPVAAPVFAGASLRLLDVQEPAVPYPAEVRKFLAETKSATLVVSRSVPGLEPVASQLTQALSQRGMRITLKDELSAFRFPAGDPNMADPMEDGFHSWRSGSEIVQPATAIDEPVILLSPAGGSYLLDGLATNGFITLAPAGAPLQTVRPTIQVATHGLHWKYDTLCLIANDPDSMRKTVEALLKESATGSLSASADPAANTGGQAARGTEAARGIEAARGTTLSSGQSTPAVPLLNFLGNEEQVVDVQFDKAGNSYIITWGHGDNLYSLDPAGKLRFARHLPEMGATRLSVYDDRLMAFTSAGSRLYQLKLDGQPISQLRLTLDPGPVGDEGYALSSAQYEYLTDRKLILQNAGRQMQLIDLEGHIVRQWVGEEYRDRDVSDRILRRELHDYAFSPDQKSIAQLETSMYFTPNGDKSMPVFDTHLVLRDLEGKKICEYLNIANEPEEATGRLEWPADAPGPAVVVKGEKWQFDPDLKVLYTRGYDAGMFRLGGQKRLARDGNGLRYLDGEKPEISRLGPFQIMPSFARLSPDGKLLAFLDEYGQVWIHEAATGKRLSGFKAPQLGHVLTFSGDSSSLVIGGWRGLVACYDLQGQSRWQTSLGQHNKHLLNPPLYDPAFPDVTENLWPTSHDRPNELDEMVRLGKDRLINGDCEAQTGWQGKQIAYDAQGYRSAHSLKVGPETVYQEVQKYLGNHVTWVVEFYYRSADPPAASSLQPPADLLAGVFVDNKYPDSVGRHFAAGKDWQFARVTVKSGLECKSIKVGFQSTGGQVLVDNITLRQIRFPSINHLQYEPLYDVPPIVLTNPLFEGDYDPFGNLRLAAPGQVTIIPYGAGGKPLAEPGFLQNGRLNDMISLWYEMPPTGAGAPRNLPISLSLSEPRWVSMVALYFNAYDADNVTPHFDIYATDMENKKDSLVASIRGNRQLFRLVKFPPIRAAQLRVELINSMNRLRTVNEIELYGPLAGQEVTGGFADPEGQNTYMGSFARVDQRAKALSPTGYENTYSPPKDRGEGFNWAVPSSQILAAQNKLYVTRTLGYNEVYDLSEAVNPAARNVPSPPSQNRMRTRALGFGPHVTLYGGLLLGCGYDGKLYCMEAQTGRELWSTQIGQRLTGCPVILGEDLFIASDTGKLYRLDLANGSTMMEVDLSGGVSGSMATDGKRLFFISADGFVQCFDPESGGQLWKCPVAPYCESTPAVEGSVLYLADTKGTAMAIAVDTGKVIWSAELGQEFTRCPVVADGRVLFGCRDGKMTALNAMDGIPLWSVQTTSRFDYEPLVLDDKVMFFDGSEPRLAELSSGAVTPLKAPQHPGRDGQPKSFTDGDDPMVSLSYYKGRIIVVPRHAETSHNVYQVNYPWHPWGGTFFVLGPAAEQKEQAPVPPKAGAGAQRSNPRRSSK